jgi:hypothetical protein
LGDFSIRAVSVYGVCLPLPFHHLVGSSVGQKTSRGQRPTEYPHILDFPAAQVMPLPSLAGVQRPQSAPSAQMKTSIIKAFAEIGKRLQVLVARGDKGL